MYNTRSLYFIYKIMFKIDFLTFIIFFIMYYIFFLLYRNIILFYGNFLPMYKILVRYDTGYQRLIVINAFIN